MSKKLSLVVALFLASMAVGWGIAPTNPEVDVALAACGAAYSCPGDTATSSLTVDHKMVDAEGGAPVEPDDGETWSIVATWSTSTAPLLCSCTDLATATATVDVQWSETTDSWSATCTSGCNASSGPIYSVSVCDGSECGGGDNGWSYELIVDIADTLQSQQCFNNQFDAYLSKVVYTTTVEDDGNEVDFGSCSEGALVSPVGDPFTATDNGAFECPFDCTASGPTVTITYE